MPRKMKSPLSVAQTDDTWYSAVRKLRTFVSVDEESDEYFRPSVFIVTAKNTGMLLSLDVIKEPISAQELNNKLVQTMVKPQKMFGVHAHRPTEIQFEDKALAESLRPLLAEVQVKVRVEPQREMVDAIIQQLEKDVFGGQEDEIPGLLTQRGVKPEQVGSLFAAAHAFYRAEPWRQLSNFDILAVQVKAQKSPYFVIVMGQGGEEYGLSVFRSWQELKSFFRAVSPYEMIPQGGRHAFLFNAPPYLSIDDLDAIEQFGWEIPSPNRVPMPVIYHRVVMKRPNAAMLRWYEAALRAIPIFVSNHLKTNPDGTHPPVEAELEVETHAGVTQVHIRYPGVDMQDLGSPEDALFNFLDEAEGIVAGPLPQMGEKDSQLLRAQQVMYDAWEEYSPIRRIALAKKALQISPHCADAYVLLAQEEAQTPRQVLETYQAGVAAGRQALGEDFLADPKNIGHYWGIFETRPFMRAMQGLATIQWEMGKLKEAERNYRELLRLNPGDNQGIRYLLLNLLLEIGRDEQALELLKQYEGDYSAEAAYTSALLIYRKKGDSPESKQALLEAFKINHHVPDYLTGKKRLLTQPSELITMSEVDEAAYYAAMHLNHWLKTPGAIDWLRLNYKTRKQGSVRR